MSPSRAFPAKTRVTEDPRIGETLEAAAAAFAEYLWGSDAGLPIRARLARHGVDEDSLREHGVGYAPGDERAALELLLDRGLEPAELYEAGLVKRSRRGRLHPYFSSRVVFPMQDAGGLLVGFAGMATNPGPSWPLWVTSPDRGRFRRREALFAIERAAEGIRRSQRAVVLKDCAEVLRARAEGMEEAIAVIRSPLGPSHLAAIATVLDAPAGELEAEPGEGGTVVRRVAAGTGSGAADAPGTPGERRRSSGTELRPDPLAERTPAASAALNLARLGLGVGIPLGWLAVIDPDPDYPGGADPAFLGAIGGAAATYVVLATVSAVLAARVRARSRARTMRGPWERGSGEWQPLAWTYHVLEEVLVGAAIVSCAVSVVLFALMGGFTG